MSVVVVKHGWGSDLLKKRKKQGEVAAPISFSSCTRESSQKLFQVLQQKEQMKRVSRAGLKIELLVPASRLFILRVHNERANSRNIGGLRGPQQGIFKKARPIPARCSARSIANLASIITGTVCRASPFRVRLRDCSSGTEPTARL